MPAPFAILRRWTGSRIGRVASGLLVAAFLAWSVGAIAPARAEASPLPHLEASGSLPFPGHHAAASPDPVDVAEPGIETDGSFPSGEHVGGEAFSAVEADVLAMAGSDRAAGWISFLPGTCHTHLADGPSPYRGPPSF